MQCEGSGTVIDDPVMILGAGDTRWIECPVCALPFSLPSGGEWTTATIPPHDTP